MHIHKIRWYTVDRPILFISRYIFSLRIGLNFLFYGIGIFSLLMDNFYYLEHFAWKFAFHFFMVYKKSYKKKCSSKRVSTKYPILNSFLYKKTLWLELIKGSNKKQKNLCIYFWLTKIKPDEISCAFLHRKIEFKIWTGKD